MASPTMGTPGAAHGYGRCKRCANVILIHVYIIANVKGQMSQVG